MQVIIPLAGKGTRLRPHTHLVPKPMLKVAGRPVMDWVMDRLDGLDVTELIFVTGHLKEQVEAYAAARYTIPSRFIEQKVQDGTAGAVNLARPFVHEPVLIIFVDTVFEADLTLINRTDADGIIWAKEVEDYQRFGVVVTDEQGYMTKIVEKPDDADLQARQHRALLHQGGGQPVAGHRSRPGRAQEQGRVLPDRRLPVDDRARQADPHRRGGRLVRLRQARHAARDQRDPAPEGRRAAGGLPRRHDPRSGVHRGRRDHRAQRDRPQRLDRERHPDQRQPAAQHDRRSRRGAPPRASWTARCWADDVVVDGLKGRTTLGDHSEVPSAEDPPDGPWRPSTISAGPIWTSSTTSIPPPPARRVWCRTTGGWAASIRDGARASRRAARR